MPSNRTLAPPTLSGKSLFSALFDYAGLFPPASLPLEEAVREYRSHLHGSERWMLGPFVIPVTRLDELETFSAFFDLNPPWSFSCLGGRGADLSDVRRKIDSDFSRIDSFLNKFGPAVGVAMYEVRIPNLMDVDPSELDTFIGGLRSSESEGPDQIYLEPARTGDFRRDVRTVAESIVREREKDARGQQTPDNPQTTGLKLRCGGMSEGDFPSPQEVAEFLYETAVSNVRFKVTAGLHHPVRHFNAGQGVTMHGFLNVFFACAFCAVHEMEPAALLPVLLEEDASAFLFSDEEIRWRNVSVTTAQLADVRYRLASSIGSCSLIEPRDDLISLGLLC